MFELVRTLINQPIMDNIDLEMSHWQEVEHPQLLQRRL